MQFEEQISAFMDGALGANEETEFLHILSVSPEKRALLHEYMSLRSMIAADARTMTVPSRLDAAILGAAGFGLAGAATGAAGAATGAAGAATGAAGAAGTAAIVSGGATPAVSGVLAAAGWWTGGRIVSAILLGLSLFTAGYIIDHSFGSSGDVDGSSTTGQSISPQMTPALPTQTSAASETASGPGQITRYRTVYVTRVDTVYLTTADAPKFAESTFRIDTMVVAISQPALGERPITITEAPQAPLQLSLPGRFDVEVQREHLTTWPYIDYQRAGVDREQQHFSVIAAYAFNEHHAAGVMIGQKSFAMEYYRIANDSLYIYQRQPVVFQGAGFYRFSLPLSAGITPEAMFQLGGTDLGPVVGGRIALRLSPFPQMSVIIGADASLLAYKYKEKIFTSHSLGLSYGIRYQF